MRRVATVGLVLMVSVALLYVVPVRALSIGEIEVKSLRGMPFLAEIPLVMTQREQQQGISATIGDQQEYQEEGVSRPKFVDRLAVSWIKGTPDILRVTSQEPISDAAFHLVLLVHVEKVTVVKSYSIVLFGSSAPPRVAAPAVAPLPPKPVKETAAAPPPKPVKETAAAPLPPKAEPSSMSSALRTWQQGLPPRYGPVKAGATLFSIVDQLGVPREMIWQVIVSLWQANQAQFTGGNLHGLKSGSFLLLPSDLAARASRMTIEEAQGIVAKQWDVWQALRRTIQGRQSAVPSHHTAIAQAMTPVPVLSLPVSEARASPAPQTPPSAELPPMGLATVPFPTELQPATVSHGDLRLVFRGLEEFLAQRLPQLEAQDHVPTPISTAELQTALHGLEDRLLQRFQTSVQQVQVPITQPPPSSLPTLLDQWLPTGSMVHVLVLENTLLLVVAAGILWRWFRSGA
jgi:Tfp pilus assembly protein FimV